MLLDQTELKSLALELAAALPPPPPMDLAVSAIDTSRQARTLRAIYRIADRHRWHSAIEHFLDMKGASHVFELTQPQLDDLLERMQVLVEAAENGYSLADCLPAS